MFYRKHWFSRFSACCNSQTLISRKEIISNLNSTPLTTLCTKFEWNLWLWYVKSRWCLVDLCWNAPYLLWPYLSQVIRRFVVFICFIYVEAWLNCTSVADVAHQLRIQDHPSRGEGAGSLFHQHLRPLPAMHLPWELGYLGGSRPHSPHLDPPLQPMMTSICYSA